MVKFITNYNEFADYIDGQSFSSVIEDVILNKEITQTFVTEQNKEDEFELQLEESTVDKINNYISGFYDTISDSSLINQLRESSMELIEFTFNGKFNIPNIQMPSSKTIKIGAGVAAGFGAVAAGLMAIRNYQKRKDGVCSALKGRDKVKCLIDGCDDAIRSISAYRKLCNEQSNPEKCQKRMDLLIEKWSKRKEKLLTKL
jgi:hypothetical protein